MSVTTVLYIHHGKGLGGAPLSLLNLIKSLDRTRYKPEVLFLHDSAARELFEKEGIHVHGPANVYDFSHTAVWWFRLRHLHLFLRAVKDTVKTIFFTADYWYNKIKPDIVHLNTSSLIGWAHVAYKKNIPVVWHIREPLASGYSGIRRAFVIAMVKRYAHTILPICAYDAQPWIDQKNVVTLYNCVNEAAFSAQKRASVMSNKKNTKDPSSVQLLFLGGDSPAKGYHALLEILFLLIKTNTNVRCVIAGYRSPVSWLRFLMSAHLRRRLFLEKKLEKNLLFVGAVHDVPALMAEADILLCPFTVAHFARPIIEAGMMGLPLIASDMSSFQEVILNEKTGFLLPANRYDLWAEKIKFLHAHPDILEKIGSQAQLFCKDRFSLKTYKWHIERVYQTIISSSGVTVKLLGE